MITPEENRRIKLIENGVPKLFLDAIDNVTDFEDLEFVFQYPEALYHYYKNIKEYSILQNYELTPIFEGSNGDYYFVLLSNSEDKKFVTFELEHDEIYSDYGSDFKAMFERFFEDYTCFAEDLTDEDILSYSKSMGYPEVGKEFI